MKAIILAGGLGTRLRSVVSDVPKPMASINGKPFLSILIDYLQSQNISEVVIGVGYLRESIINHFGVYYNGVKISYSMEEAPLGTGGAIMKALQDIKEDVLVINGDTFCPINYKEFIDYHTVHKSKFSMVLKPLEDVSRYGKVEINTNSIITTFCDKGVEEGLINCGIYLINKDLLSKFDLPYKFSFEADFMKKYTKELNILGYCTDGYFIDIGIPEDYSKFCEIISNEK